ncbi:MAG: hypothetical protein KA821_07635 [Chitinophagaceae bacterium]|nr:hypothetical protein [Chitinophagaceae bacterium]
MEFNTDLLKPFGKKQINANEFILLFTKYKKVINVQVVDKLELTSKEYFKLKESEILNCDFEDEVIIKSAQTVTSLIIVNCIFKKRFLLFDSKLQRTKLLRSTFNQYFAFKQLDVHSLTVQNCIINNIKELKLHEFRVSELIFKNNEADNDVHLKPLSIKKLVLEGSGKEYRITFSNLESKQILEEIYLFNYSSYRTDYLLRNFISKKLQLIGELKDSSIFINNAKIQTGIADYFSNYGNLKISGLSPLTDQALLVIKNSLIGKAQIDNCDFSSFNRIIIASSNIIDIIPVNIMWCSTLNLQSSNIDAVKENYRQLKLVASKNGDLEKKLAFEKQEMRLFLDIIKRKKGHFGDKFILFTNFYSNNFGLSWLRAFYWLFGSTIIWYTTIKYLSDQTKFDKGLILDEIGKFLLFLNPIHYFERIFGYDPISQGSNGTMFFDAVSRIFGAYFIYQFVSAFRKYSKG